MHVKCPSCSQTLNVPNHLAGKAVKCPCGKVLKTRSASSQQTSTNAASFQVTCPKCGSKRAVPASIIGKDVRVKCGCGHTLNAKLAQKTVQPNAQAELSKPSSGQNLQKFPVHRTLTNSPGAPTPDQATPPRLPDATIITKDTKPTQLERQSNVAIVATFLGLALFGVIALGAGMFFLNTSTPKMPSASNPNSSADSSADDNSADAKSDPVQLFESQILAMLRERCSKPRYFFEGPDEWILKSIQEGELDPNASGAFWRRTKLSWTLGNYDVSKTDSLTSPYEAIVEVTQEREYVGGCKTREECFSASLKPEPRCTIRFRYAMSNGQWELLKHAGKAQGGSLIGNYYPATDLVWMDLDEEYFVQQAAF